MPLIVITGSTQRRPELVPPVCELQEDLARSSDRTIHLIAEEAATTPIAMIKTSSSTPFTTW